MIVKSGLMNNPALTWIGGLGLKPVHVMIVRGGNSIW